MLTPKNGVAYKECNEWDISIITSMNWEKSNSKTNENFAQLTEFLTLRKGLNI